MNYDQIISFFLSTSVITTEIVYLSKTIFNRFIDTKIEKYKNSLQKDLDNFRYNLSFEAEKFKYELSTSSTEHQIKYSKLYEERGQIVKNTYNLLLELENTLSNLTTIFQGEEWVNRSERDENATNSVRNLNSHLEQNRIYFSEDLCEKIESIMKSSQEIISNMYMAKNHERINTIRNKRGSRINDDELIRPTTMWFDLDEKVKKYIRATRLDLAQDFRILISVSS